MTEALRIKRNPWVTAAASALWALIPVTFLAWALTGLLFPVIAPHLFIFGGILFWMMWKRRPYARKEPTRVEVKDGDLRAGELRVPKDAIRRAEIVPGARPTVRLSLRRRLDEDFELSSDEDARALLRALGFDATQTTATYRLMSLMHVRYRWAPIVLAPLFLVLGVASAKFPPLLGVLGPLFIFSFVGLAAAPTMLTVGADGLLIRWLWTSRFVPLKEIRSVGRFERGFGRNRVRGISLALEGGAQLELPILSSWNDDEIGVVHKRIEDVMALARSPEKHAVEDDALVLERGGLSHREWLEKLAALGSGANATLRVAPVMPDRLWRVALDPAREPSARAAAAIALRPSLDKEGRARLAEAAKATAAPKLRVALERASEDTSEEALEAALRELDS